MESIIDKLETIGTAFGAVLFTGYIIYKKFSAELKKWKLEEKNNISSNITKQSQLDCELIQEAEKLKEMINADRIHVYEFHNGVHYANGRSALRTSCTYEVCRYGVESYLKNLSGIPLSIIPNFIKTLLDKKEICAINIESMKEEMPSSYSLLSSMGVKSFYCFTINNDKGEPVGFVSVHFCNVEVKNVNKDLIKKFAWFVESKLSEM